VLWRAVSLVIACLPWSWLALLGCLLGWLVGRVLRIRRAHAIHALRRAGIEPAPAVASRVYASLGRVVFELLWMTGRPNEPLERVVEFDPVDWQRARVLLERGRGVVVASAHTGNWDLLACAVAARMPVSVLTRHMSWRALDRFWQRARAGRGVSLIDAAGALRSAMGALATGGVVGFMVDQAPERQRAVVTAPFLGAPARHDLTFALVAMRARAPIVVAVDERLRSGRHRVHLLDVIEPPERPSHRWAVDTCFRVNDSLQGFVREHPDQWLWLHRRWKGT
jgi:Kdo2-lipid IVA lauroyltransferase/acyltransferase